VIEPGMLALFICCHTVIPAPTIELLHYIWWSVYVVPGTLVDYSIPYSSAV
jgi:hypothetical protein